MPEPTLPEAPAIAPADFAALQTQVRDLTAALDDIEVRSQRAPAQPKNPKDQEERELRALASYVRTGNDAEIRAAGSTPDADGGFFILPTVDRTIRNLLEDVSPMRSLAEVVSISSNTYERFYSTGNRGAVWVQEKTTRPQDTARPELIKHSYGVAEMYAAPAATRHLLEDASFDVAGWFNTWVANDFALTEAEAFWRGNGEGNKPRGLLTYPTAATADATRAWGTFQYVPAGHASAPTDDNLAKALIALCLTVHPRFRPNAKWVMNNATFIRARQLQDGNKRFLWAPTGGMLDSAENGTLLGYPVEIDNSMDDIGADAFPVAFGDFRQAYVVVDRHGLRVERDAVTQKGIVLFDTYSRVGGGAGDSRAVKFLKVATA